MGLRRKWTRERAREDDRRRRQLSRRQFLAGTALTGVALGLPPWLSGCGSDDRHNPATPTPGVTPSPTPTATPVPRPRERRTLHFDFSYAQLGDLRLRAVGSASNGASIAAHTAASRAVARQRDPLLVEVPDARLTHYVEDVDLPSDALQSLLATGTTAGGEDAVAAFFIHVPAAAAPPAAPRTVNEPGIENLVVGVPGFVTIFDTAAALVFHAPEIMNLNVAQGSAILGMIANLPCDPGDSSCTPFICQLAIGVAEKWPATTSGGWATLVQIVDGTTPVVDEQGNPVYRYDVDPDIALTVGTVAQNIRTAVFGDTQFEGTNWHPTQGVTTIDSPAPTGSAAGAAAFSVTAAYPRGTHPHGVKFVTAGVTDAANRTVQLQFRNDYLRYLSTYVQFANEAGDLPVQNPTSEDTDRAKFLAWINSNFTVLGIPRLGDDVPLSTVQFDVPADASIAKVYFGSLGVGGDPFCPEAVAGSILTLIFNLGIPTIMLAAGVAVTASLLADLSKEFGVGIVQILKASLPLILAQTGIDLSNGIFGSANSHSAKEALIELGNAVLSAFLAGGGGIVVGFLLELGIQLIGGVTTSLMGPVGVIFRLVAVAADLATLLESVFEVLCNPALFINTLTLTMTTTVTISHDPDDFQFPATARNYEVILTYDSASKVAHKQSGTIEPGRTDPLVVVFDDVPSGGMVTVDVYLTTDDGYIVGRSADSGTPGPYGPVPGTQAAIALAIKELLIPLTSNTQYVHDVKLEYQNGEHVWVAGPAPTATITSLEQGSDDTLNGLGGITISQRTGMAGYTYFAGGQGVPFCGQTTSGVMHMLQNVFLGEGAESGLKQIPCGFQQAFGIVYDKLGAPGGSRNFFVQPSELGYLLQPVTLAGTTPFDLDNPLTWGVFTRSLESLAVVPTGFVVGVDRHKHKMQILELPAAPSNPSTAPQAVPFAVSKMGFGTRPGLLNTPVAVTVIDAAILILEDGNQRIQAVDASGNPVLRFQNGTTNIVELEQGAGIVYLDLGVEGLGYMYVLSFVNDGAAVADYRLDIYDPQGTFLTRTTGVAAARLAVDTFRNVYALNYATIAGAPRVEPSLSQWNPCAPGACPTPTPSAG